MKSMVIVANCQSRALARTLLECDEFASEYTWDSVPYIQDLTLDQVPMLREKIQNADLFLYQPIASHPRRPEELTSRYLCSHTKPGAKVLSFPSVYFNGYFPHLFSFNGHQSVLNFLHDMVIMYCYAIGLSRDEVENLITNRTLYNKKLATKLCKESIQNLKNRENTEKLDIRVSGFIARHYRTQKLFYQFNHPQRSVLQFMAESVLKKIGIRDYQLDDQGESYLNLISVPIYASTHNSLKLKFAEDFGTYSDVKKGTMSLSTIIEAFYDCYEPLDNDELHDHVVKNRPYIPDMIKTARQPATGWFRKAS